MADKLIIIRIRGGVDVRGPIKDTMTMLNLPNQHNCVIVDDTPTIRGMLRKVQGYVTYGVADEETAKLLAEKLGKEKKTVRLAPPRKGFERKGIKVSFAQGGALGNRGEKINELVKKML